jgi:hypothetical protein
LPSDETTPPVMKMNRAMGVPDSRAKAAGARQKSENRKPEARKRKGTQANVGAASGFWLLVSVY